MYNIGAFAEIAEVSHTMASKLLEELSDILHEDKLIGMEIPPVTRYVCCKVVGVRYRSI